jgi:hypothetical protein
LLSKEAVTFLKKSNQKTFVLGPRALDRTKHQPHDPAGRLKGGRNGTVPEAPGAKIFCGAFL